MMALPTQDDSDARMLEQVNAVEIYRTAVSHYLHSNRLSWSRAQAITVIEGGIFAAAFYLRNWQGALTLCGGSVLVVIFWVLIERDWEIRDQHLPFLDKIHETTGIRMREDPKQGSLSGHEIVQCTMELLILLNTAFAMYLWIIDK